MQNAKNLFKTMRAIKRAELNAEYNKKSKAVRIDSRNSKQMGFLTKFDFQTNVKELEKKGLIDIDEIGIRRKIKAEIERHKKFQAGLLGQKSEAKVSDVDIRNYAKYLIREGTVPEKRELMSCFKSQIIFRNKKIFLQ